MFWFRGCPKCGGDLTEQRDIYGAYVSCLQCGYELRAAEEAAIRQGVAVARMDSDALAAAG